MLTLLRAGLTALVLSLAAMPAFAAAEGCRPLDALLIEVQEAASAGARVVLFQGDEAPLAMAAIEVLVGPPPRPLAPSPIIMVIGDRLALALFAEGSDVCLKLPLSLENARRLEAMVRGEPA